MGQENRPTADDARSDGELARLVADGDDQAAATLIRRYERLVRSFLRRVTGRFELADDLAQDTFVRLLTNAHRYDPKYPMRTWLLTIARRLSINRARRADERVVSTEYLGQSSAFDGPAEKAEAGDLQQARRKLIDQALLELSDSQRTAVVLFHEEEMSIEQIAEVMAMPVGTIKSHLHRGRAALRKILGPQLEVIES